ncbi:MAG: hypothetical protein P4L41_01815 [Flavipsychrobacter sp.]|nr:hypothetical protein [Flavipsychrobacter sp.]
MTAKIKEWLKRYLPAELLSTAATLGGGIIAYRIWNNATAIALVATWAGNLFYFGYILFNDVYWTKKTLHAHNKKYNSITFFKNIHAFVVEFGIAEVLDSFLIRPLLIYYLPLVIGNLFAGLLLAKFIADITFYIPAILSYEFAKKHFRNFS